MGIATTKSFADIDAGTQVEVQIADAVYHEDGRFGAEVELNLDVLKPTEHAGDTIFSTFGLSQPRLNKVRNLRADELDDEAIAAILRKKGFDFENIDDPETPRLGGALLKIVKACFNNDARAVRKLLAECDTFHDLAEALVGRSFIATTRKDKNDYTRLDGKGEFYRVMSEESVGDVRQKQQQAAAATKPEIDESDFDDIPW